MTHAMLRRLTSRRCIIIFIIIIIIIIIKKVNKRKPEPSGDCTEGAYRRDEARIAERGGGVLGEGQPASPPSTPNGVRGGAPAAEGFSCILFCQIASLGTSVRAAYSLWGTNTWLIPFTVI